MYQSNTKMKKKKKKKYVVPTLLIVEMTTDVTILAVSGEDNILDLEIGSGGGYESEALSQRQTASWGTDAMWY